MSIKIVSTGKYLPDNVVSNESLERDNNLEHGYIFKRTGIKNRFYINDETIDILAIKSVEDMLKKNKSVNIYDIDLIICASTSYDNFMPSVSFKVQRYFKIENCICLDIMAGCSGYINALSIAQKYIYSGVVKKALVLGVECLSKNKYKDIKSKMLFGDGAGCALIEHSKINKIYFEKIESYEDVNSILTCTDKHVLNMNGKEVYKFAVTKTVENIEKLLKESNINKSEVCYIVPHQSNIKILNKIFEKTSIKVFSNIEKYANTFCASIPIALNNMLENKIIKEKDKIILLGYGGGLNLGSILMEV